MVQHGLVTSDGPGLEAPISLRQMLPNATVKVRVTTRESLGHFEKNLEKAKKAHVKLDSS